MYKVLARLDYHVIAIDYRGMYAQPRKIKWGTSGLFFDPQCDGMALAAILGVKMEALCGTFVKFQLHASIGV